MKIEGQEERQPTQYPAGDTTAEWYAYKAGPPIWDSNRNLISYSSRQNSNYSIFSIKPDGTGLNQITADGLNEIYNSWSPDGNRLVYDGSDTDESNYDIFLMDIRSGKVNRLTTDSTYEQDPVFVTTT